MPWRAHHRRRLLRQWVRVRRELHLVLVHVPARGAADYRGRRSVRRLALALALLAACGGGATTRRLELYAARQHACSDADTWVQGDPDDGAGPWVVAVCNHRYEYERTASGGFRQTADLGEGIVPPEVLQEYQSGPHCVRGCRCGRSCIPCSHRCRH